MCIGRQCLRIIYRRENFNGLLWADPHPKGPAEDGSIHRFYGGNAFKETNSHIISLPNLRGQRWEFTYLFTCGYLGDGKRRLN